MQKIVLIIACIAVIVAFAVVIYNIYSTKHTFDTLEKMIDSAVDGSFSEKLFDESRLSRLETKLAHYLSSSALSKQNTDEEKDRIKTLISDISHQTKTPIANILLYSELLEEQNLNEPVQSYADAIAEQTKKLDFLIYSLIKLSRLENGIISLSPQRRGIDGMLGEIYTQFKTKAEQKGLRFEMKESGCSAFFDGKWTAEAVGNIVDNAVKYTSQGSVTITSKQYELFSCIEISDTGAGIDEREQAQIFLRFYRSQSSNNTEGVGIGLYLAREIISSEGGYIKLRSALGKGTVFYIYLPR